jgi:hypothetical protein
LRYRLEFHAKKDDAFNWDANDVIETDDLLSLIFQFQIVVTKEFRRIIDESKKVMVDDDIPF